MYIDVVKEQSIVCLELVSISTFASRGQASAKTYDLPLASSTS